MGKNAKILKLMTAEEKAAFIRQARVEGGRKRAAQFTSASQRRARRKLSSDQAAENGRLGAQRTMALHGIEKLCEASRQKRLNAPNYHELTMMGVLGQLKVGYEREYLLGDTRLTVDFYCTAHALAIEVDGSIHDPGKPDFEKRQARDARKAALCNQLGIRLLRVHHSELGDNLMTVVDKIRDLLKSAAIRSGSRPPHQTAAAQAEICSEQVSA